MSDDADGVQRLAMVASAIAGRPLAVAAAEPGEPAWTDGNSVYLDPSSSVREQVEAVAVQASLLATGGLESDVVARLVRKRSALAERYLTVEGHRALQANEDLLPVFARGLINREIADLVATPDESLAVAAGELAFEPAPRSFGIIRARKLLAAQRSAAASTVNGHHAPRTSSDRELPDLARRRRRAAR